MNLTAIYDLGSVAFGSLHDFTQWVILPQEKFNNQAPIDLIKTEEGYKIIYEELQKMTNVKSSTDNLL